MSVIDIWEIKKEWVFFLRNSDIFSTTTREVTTAQDTGTFSGDTNYIIDVPNAKNIRSIIVDGNILSYGSDYNVDLDYNDSGNIKIKFVFTIAQTGAFTITYDYGSDHIFPDFPRSDLTIGSFPRIGADIISIPSDIFNFDGNQIATINMTTNVYAASIEDINNYITAISVALKNAEKDFYYIGKFVRKVSIGPILKIATEISQDKIFQQNIDTQGMLNFER